MELFPQLEVDDTDQALVSKRDASKDVSAASMVWAFTVD